MMAMEPSAPYLPAWATTRPVPVESAAIETTSGRLDLSATAPRLHEKSTASAASPGMMILFIVLAKNAKIHNSRYFSNPSTSQILGISRVSIYSGSMKWVPSYSVYVSFPKYFSQRSTRTTPEAL